jgi:hypothetical protein
MDERRFSRLDRSAEPGAYWRTGSLRGSGTGVMAFVMKENLLGFEDGS